MIQVLTVTAIGQEVIRVVQPDITVGVSCKQVFIVIILLTIGLSNVIELIDQVVLFSFGSCKLFDILLVLGHSFRNHSLVLLISVHV